PDAPDIRQINRVERSGPGHPLSRPESQPHHLAGASVTKVQGYLKEHCVLRFCPLQKRDIRVCFFPKSQEILVGSPCSRPVPCGCKRTTKLQECHRTHGIGEDNARVVEYLL